MRATVVVGGGRITSALLAGLRLANYNKPLVVYDRNRSKLQRLKKQHRVEIADNLQDAIQQAQLLIIAVRPDSLKALLHEIGTIHRPLVAISLVAGVPLSKLRARLGPPVRWARAMPSPACRIGHGLTALVFARDFPPSGKSEVHNLFANVGPVLEIPESQFDAFTVTYSSSHGYHAMEALANAAAALGLPRKTALIAAAHALADGILAWRKSKIPLHRLLHEAATPGGIAASVMAAKNKAGYRKAVQKGLNAGLARARRNARL